MGTEMVMDTEVDTETEVVMESIEVNGKTYYAEKPKEHRGDWKIVALQRGWVMIGRFSRDGSDCELSDASVIRTWGTSKGLGQLSDGPLRDTNLDPCNGVVKFDILTMVFSIDVNDDAWEKVSQARRA